MWMPGDNFLKFVCVALTPTLELAYGHDLV